MHTATEQHSPAVTGARLSCLIPSTAFRLNPSVLAGILVLFTACVRIAYLLWDCPLDLSPDEGHYWDWSRHLDWSYYSKGPLVAYLIRASCFVFGEKMWAVRLPAVLCGSLTLMGLYVLVRRVYQQAELALGVVVVCLTLPAMAASSLLMTIDAPYICCWTWSLVLADRALQKHSGQICWVGLGLMIGAGILAKYTMVIFIPCFLLFLLTSTAYRYQLVSLRLWLMILVAGLCCLPIVVWNAQHGWMTVLHVGRQAGIVESTNGSGSGLSTVRWYGLAEYLAGQAVLLLGFWFVAWLAAMVRFVPYQSRTSDKERFLWWMSVPMFLLFLGFSLNTRVELNWPIAAYLSGSVLTVRWLFERSDVMPSIKWIAKGFAVVGVLGSVLLHHTEWLYRLHGEFVSGTSPRKWDATCRLRGFQTLASEVETIWKELRDRGEDVVITANGWNIHGVLAFYLCDQPMVYSLGLATGGRHSQYDFWLPNPLSNPEAFYGKTFIYVGEMVPNIAAGFESVPYSKRVAHIVSGYEVASWSISVGKGFKGFRVPNLPGH